MQPWTCIVSSLAYENHLMPSHAYRCATEVRPRYIYVILHPSKSHLVPHCDYATIATLPLLHGPHFLDVTITEGDV
jgi:hypothetical protein